VRSEKLHSNRFFRTFGANKKQKSPPINNLHDLSNHTFTLFPKSIQVVDVDLTGDYIRHSNKRVAKGGFRPLRIPRNGFGTP
jgi:hypothetical protein